MYIWTYMYTHIISFKSFNEELYFSNFLRKLSIYICIYVHSFSFLPFLRTKRSMPIFSLFLFLCIFFFFFPTGQTPKMNQTRSEIVPAWAFLSFISSNPAPPNRKRHRFLQGFSTSAPSSFVEVREEISFPSFFLFFLEFLNLFLYS